MRPPKQIYISLFIPKRYLRTSCNKLLLNQLGLVLANRCLSRQEFGSMHIET